MLAGPASPDRLFKYRCSDYALSSTISPKAISYAINSKPCAALLLASYGSTNLQGNSLNMQDKITAILNYLNENKTRCSNNAAAEALGITAPELKKLLGERRPETSWLVNYGTGEPAGYSADDKHPDLYLTKRIFSLR
jgi:hypothetical protein